jgi:hypothetical protein
MTETKKKLLDYNLIRFALILTLHAHHIAYKNDVWTIKCTYIKNNFIQFDFVWYILILVGDFEFDWF